MTWITNDSAATNMKTYSYQPITTRTRVGHSGSPIKCPHCDYVRTIYHLAWVANTCGSCKEMVDKYDYTILKANKPSQNRLQGA